MSGFSSWDLDATSAFVSTVLPDDEVVYMETIPGFPLPKGKCSRLLRTLYGLLQAPLAFYKLCREVYTRVLAIDNSSGRVMNVFLFDMKSMSRRVLRLRKSCGP
jgi:hypothetical protein